MQAIQPLKPDDRPRIKQRRSIRPQVIQQRRSQRYHVIALEAGIKLTTHILLSACVVSALVQIWPHYRSTEEKLGQIQSEVQLTRERVSSEQADFSRLFDPHQTSSMMQEYSNRVAPGQRQVIWLEDRQADHSESYNSPNYAGSTWD